MPPGWPGDDPTLEDEVVLLGGRPPRQPAGVAAGARPGGVTAGPTGAPGRGDGRGAGGADPPPPDAHRDPDGDPGGDADPAAPDARGDDADADPSGPEAYGEAGVDDLVAGVQPAGRALVVMVAALVLAVLINADALVERAESQPPGPQRDRALTVWQPVRDASHVLQLHRVRQVADRVLGGAGEERGGPSGGRPPRPGSEASDAGTGGAGRSSDAAAGRRVATPDDPLRVWVGGDFMAQAVGRALADATEAGGTVDAVLHVEPTSGLTRDDHFDWPRALALDVARNDPEVVVVMVGANDGQGILLDDGTPVPEVDDPRWLPEYRRRVGALMDQLRGGGRMVVWVGQPPMRDPRLDAKMTLVNRAYAGEAADRAWVSYVDAAAAVGGPDGGYTEARAGAGPLEVPVRGPDGIHLTPAGAGLLADRVLAAVEVDVDLAAAEADIDLAG